jgi:hypothetical protein
MNRSINNQNTETGVTYTQEQFESIQQIQESLKNNCPEDEYTDEKEQDPELTSRLMQLCMLVVMQDTSKVSLYASPLMHYLAVRGVDAHSQSLRSAFFYTPILAQVLWVIRVIMLEVAVPLEAWPALGLKSKAEIQSIPTRVHKLRSRHLCEGSYSPASSILSQLAMGKKFNKVHQSPANIHWAEDEQTIYYEGQGVEISKIQDMCQEMIRELRELMQKLAFRLELPAIDLSQIIDSMAWSQEFRRLNYSFISQKENQEKVDVGYQYLLKHARDARGAQQLIKKSGSGVPEWIDTRKQAYLNQERRFLRKLMGS